MDILTINKAIAIIITTNKLLIRNGTNKKQ